MRYTFFRKLLRKANARQVDEILTEAVKRREELFPGWEMIYVALPKNDSRKRIEMLREMLKLAEGELEKDSCF